jgi:hypothetical protein
MISAEKATGLPISVACAPLGVSRSAYCDWERGAPSERERTAAWLLEQIKTIHADNRGVHGWRRIHAELRLAHGAAGVGQAGAAADAPGRHLGSGASQAARRSRCRVSGSRTILSSASSGRPR